MKAIFFSLLLLVSTLSIAQKKTLDHQDFNIWNSIQDKTISPNGDYIMYSLEKGEADNFLKIKNAMASTIFEYERSQKGQFSYDSNYALFTVKAYKDSISELKRKKVKKDKMPHDTLGIYSLKDKSLHKIAHVKSYKIPEKWSGYVAYQLEEIKPEKKDSLMEEKADEPKKEKEKKKKVKKVSDENGYHLVLQNLSTKKQDTFKFVTNYTFAKKGKRLAFTTTGEDDQGKSGVFVLNLDTELLTPVYEIEKAKFYQLSISESGKNLAFVSDEDTTKVQERPNKLFTWLEGQTAAKNQLDPNSAPKGYRVSADGDISFSKDETKLFFGLGTPTIVKDTTLIDEEIVNVEVWTYDEPRLYTVQELQLKNDLKKSYLAAIHLKNDKLVQLASTEYPDESLGDEGNAKYALVNTALPYQLESQWTGNQARDYAKVDVNTGDTKHILSKITGRVRLSPAGKYAFGYNEIDSTWFTYDLDKDKFIRLTEGKVFYDELNDSPDYPRSYGAAGWTENDGSILIYDRYDIWKFDPVKASGIRLTKGRENNIVYRYVELDKEERFLDNKKWLLTIFNETTKDAGFVEFNPKNLKEKTLLKGPYRFSDPIKATLNDKIIFTRESFTEFPDLHYGDLSFKDPIKMSLANPQQKDYHWGNIELVKWTSLDGIELTGMLVKPDNFDPQKKYPMIVNFYEKSSNNLHRHWAPSPGRSTINYSFYASRGYVIFNPDVYYRIGYPGESAYNCVIPGVTSLIEKGFVDKDNIGVQGHSWGGYQIAYLVTKTNIFKAAEAGAPVPNMISAYGGIRWWTGLSRQFQYEHTQSRIGGTPWEYPARYIENSPIFNVDKINTPLLIMHNDADGHVPWYQGIELFVSLRRLGKPSWFLNYNDEPHWPLKWQNRKDFNIRLAQFLDHYLKGAPKPVWMERGVPAIEKGIHQGYELLSTDDKE